MLSYAPTLQSNCTLFAPVGVKGAGTTASPSSCRLPYRLRFK